MGEDSHGCKGWFQQDPQAISPSGNDRSSRAYRLQHHCLCFESSFIATKAGLLLEFAAVWVHYEALTTILLGELKQLSPVITVMP